MLSCMVTPKNRWVLSNLSTVLQERASWAMAAGISLGLLLLGRGAHASGVENLDLDAHLRHLMLGGQPHAAVAKRWGYRSCGTDPSMNAYLDDVPSLARSGQADSAAHAAIGGSVAADIAAAQSGAKTILTEGLLDTEASCPAASVALTLAYLQTNNDVAAAMFRMPGNH